MEEIKIHVVYYLCKNDAIMKKAHQLRSLKTFLTGTLGQSVTFVACENKEQADGRSHLEKRRSNQ